MIIPRRVFTFDTSRLNEPVGLFGIILNFILRRKPPDPVIKSATFSLYNDVVKKGE